MGVNVLSDGDTQDASTPPLSSRPLPQAHYHDSHLYLLTQYGHLPQFGNICFCDLMFSSHVRLIYMLLSPLKIIRKHFFWIRLLNSESLAQLQPKEGVQIRYISKIFFFTVWYQSRAIKGLTILETAITEDELFPSARCLFELHLHQKYIYYWWILLSLSITEY